MKFKFYSDPGHGWIAVKINLLEELGIADKISSYSYMKGSTAYLEEDCDASLFFYAYQEVHQTTPPYESRHNDKRSPIRSYEPYKYVKTNTEKIFELTAPYSNQYQSLRTRILFVCSVGLLRSPTGAHVGSLRGYNTRSCGSSKEALIPLSVNLIEWAEHIVFVNYENFSEAVKTFSPVGYKENLQQKAVILDIPDDYDAFHPSLITEFNNWFDIFERKDNV